MFYCNFCPFVTASLISHIQHHNRHRNITHFYYCGIDKCKKYFQNQSILRQHFIKAHGLRSKKRNNRYSSCSPNDSGKYVCTIDVCKKEFDDYLQLINHLRHHLKRQEKITCPFRNCENKYTVLSSFTSHLSKIHKKINKTQRLENFGVTQRIAEENVLLLSEEINESKQQLLHDQNVLEVQDSQVHKTKESDLIVMKIAHFYLKLKNHFLLPASTIRRIISEMNNIQDQRKLIIKEKVRHHLIELKFSSDIIDSFVKDIFESDPIAQANEKFELNYKRKNFFNEYFQYIEPIQIDIDKEINKHFVYVPIAETIVNFYTDKSIENEIENPFGLKLNECQVNRDADILKNFMDGTVYKNNEFFQKNPKGIKIILYQDVFEIANPLGSVNEKNKLLAIYMTLGNISDHLRSHENSIKLVALCNLTDFDYAKVYGKIVKDLLLIETEGIEIRGSNLKGSVVYISGDNLECHSLGGFVENFSTTKYFCRFCVATREEFQGEKGAGKTYALRDPKSYNQAITLIDGKNDYQGIRFNAIFNQLKYYHVCSPGLPPCLGRDLFENIVAYDLKLFIDYFVENKCFTFDQLNAKIKNFNYSPEDKRDQPCTVEASSRGIEGGVCQIWNLLRIFPLLIEDKLKDLQDDVWMCVLLLNEVVEIVCAPVIHRSFLAYLHSVICEYIYMRQMLFSDSNLRPQHHYLFHYAKLTLDFGPLIKLWTLRFENQREYFKKAMRHLPNYVNVTKSLSEKFQSLARSRVDNRMKTKVFEVSNFQINIYNERIQEAVRSAQLPQNIQECNKFAFKGTVYKKGYCLFLSQAAYRYRPVIGKISFILYLEEKIHIIFEVLESQYIPYLGAFQLGKLLSYECRPFHTVLDCKPLFIYNTGNKLYIKNDHAIVSQSE